MKEMTLPVLVLIQLMMIKKFRLKREKIKKQNLQNFIILFTSIGMIV